MPANRISREEIVPIGVIPAAVNARNNARRTKFNHSPRQIDLETVVPEDPSADEQSLPNRML
jgi:hypothetical protein